MAMQIPGVALDDQTSGRQALTSNRPVVGPAVDVNSLRPVASPVDTFIHAAQPATNAPELGRIADALSAFQPELAQYSQTQKMLNNQQAETKVPQLLGGQGPDEMRKTMQGNPAFQNVAASRLGQSLLGAAQSNATLEEARQAYFSGGFDKQHGDFNDFVNGYVKRDLAANPDPFFAKSYMGHISGGIEQLRGQYTQDQVGFQRDSQNNLIGGAVTSAINDGLTKGATPQAVMAGLQTTFGTIKTIANRPIGEQQQLLLGEIEKQATTLDLQPDYEKRFEMIRGMLSQGRTDPVTGQAFPSLMDNPNTGGKAAEVLMKATSAYENRFEVQNQGVVGDLRHAASTADPSYPAQRDQLIQQHPLMVRGAMVQRMDAMFDSAQDRAKLGLQAQNLAAASQREQSNYLTDHVLPSLGDGTAAAGGLQDTTLHDAKGNEVNYPVASQIKDGVAIAQSNLDRQFAGKENDPQAMEQKFQSEVKLYTVNGQTNPTWKRTLNAGASSALTAAGGEENAITPALSSGYDLYKKLDAASPAAAQASLSGNAERLYSLAQAGEQAGLSTQQSLKMAVQATGDKEFIKNLPSLSMTETHQDIQNALSANAGNSWWPFGNNLSTVSNSSEVESRVHEFATLLHGAAHIPLDEAIKLSAARVAKQFTIINGTAIDTSGKSMPGNFKDLANGFIDNWWQDHGAAEEKEGHDKSDLTIHQLGNTPQWAFYYKSSGFQPGSPHAAFGLPELYGVANQQHNKATGDLGKAFNDATQGRHLRDLTGGATGPM